jgi:hypothetical protein
MTWQELANWVKIKKTLTEQVDIMVQDDKDWNAPFVGFTCIHPKVNNGNPLYDLHVDSWEAEDFERYTWQNLLDWIDTIPNKDEPATVMVAWHKLQTKIINKDLYCYDETKF